MRRWAGSVYSTDPTQEKNVLDHAHHAVPTRFRELDHTDPESICLKDLDHELWEYIIQLKKWE